jgi:hypothetical protein
MVTTIPGHEVHGILVADGVGGVKYVGVGLGAGVVVIVKVGVIVGCGVAEMEGSKPAILAAVSCPSL